MANLETLELTINANAESASKGLSSLIGSLSTLSGQVNRNVGALKALNTEISKLKSAGSIKLPNFSQGVNSSASVKRVRDAATAMQQQVEAITGVSKATKSAKDSALWMDKLMGKQALESRGKAVADTIKEQIKEQQEQIIPPSTPYTKYGMTAERWGAMSQAEQKTFEKQIRMQYRMQQEAQNTKQVMQETAPAIQEVKNATADLAKTEKEVAPAMEDNGVKQKSFRDGFRDLAKDISSSIPKFKMLHRVLRIGTTMLIRMGIRGLFKGVKEGLGNYYQYAKATGGQFTKEIDGLTSAWSQLKNQMGAAIAPAIGAVIPILNGIASAAISAFNALSQLFALLGGKGVWSKATAQVTAFDAAAQKAGGGGGGLKEMLAKFDELNVIAQEGGGGGGGGGTTAEEYMSMFEDMYEFDSRIRDIANFIRETVQWVKDNMDVVLQSAILIGTAILGWKMSKAFEGALGELGRLITGGALVTLGIVLDFDFGKKIGSGATLSWLDWVEGIGGIIAAGIGGYLIAGTTGLVIGIGVTIMATIAGIFVGALNKADAAKWGNVSLSAEEVRAYVQQQFNMKIYADVELVGGKLKNTVSARVKLATEIKDFEQSLRKIRLGIDTSEAAISTAKTGADTVIKELKSYMESSENLLTAYLNVMPYDDATQSGFAKDIFEANEKLKAYVTQKGEEIAKWYDLGMKNQWKGEEQEQILALMEHVNNIMNAMSNAASDAKTKASLKLSMSNLTRSTASDILAEQKRILSEYKDTLKEAMLEQASMLEGYAAAAMEAGMPELANTYREKAKWLVDTFESSMDKNLREAKDPIKQTWIDSLSDIFGSDVDHALYNIIMEEDGYFGKFFENGLKQRIGISTDSAADFIKGKLAGLLDIDPIIKDASELYGFTGWDLLGDYMKKKFYDTIQEATGNATELLSKAGIPANEIIKVSGYDALSTREKLNFVNALVKAYGAQEALTAAKDAGINVAEAINSGLSGRNAGAKSAANQLVNTINDELKNRNITIDVGAHVEVAIDAIVNIAPKIINTTGNTITKTAQTATASFTGGIAGAIKNASKATGAYGIPAGDLFIANEAGAELVGSLNGKTTVANQGQIIEGIQRGVAEANESQNALLRQQNELLRGILEKETSINFGASPAFGRTVRQSLDMYSGMTGGR